MEKVAIDRKLFVSCRLCVEEMGMYQIVPKVQEQIKYCFDIDVDPFDRLPQLICEKCESILSSYYVTKNKFVEKQKSLRNTILLQVPNVSTPQEAVSSSQEVDDKQMEISRSPAISECSNDLTSTKDDVPVVITNFESATPTSATTRKRIKKVPCDKWKADYKKQFVCKICQKICKTKGTMKLHLRVHEVLLKKSVIYNNDCSVNLNRIDDKPNLTGQLNCVVHDNDKIICNEGKADYYIIYFKDRIRSTDITSEETKKRQASLGLYKVPDSCDEDDDDDDIKLHKKKRRRMISSSSNETVVLEGDEKPASSDDDKTSYVSEPKNTECINIDSSDSESLKSMELRSNERNDKKKPHIADYKTIQNIILMCHSKYQKKHSLNEIENPKIVDSKTESYLKFKILSIGRKVLNKRGFNCTGLLRYLECKNLEINWIPTNLNKKEACYIRIMARLKGKQEGVADDFGWTNVWGQSNTSSKWSEVIEESPNHIVEQISQEDNKRADTPPCATLTKSCPEPPKTHNKENPLLIDLLDRVILYPNLPSTDTDMKLLNENPVANPKQLPKKTSVDLKSNSKATIEEFASNTSTSNHDVQNDESIYINEEDEYTNNSELCMPIITSTTSLAVPKISSKNEAINRKKDEDVINNRNDSEIICATGNNVTPDTNAAKKEESSAPRIKVKPVSELMSERVLINMNQQHTTLPDNIFKENTPSFTPHCEPIQNVFLANKVMAVASYQDPNIRTLEIVPLNVAPSSNSSYTTPAPSNEPKAMKTEIITLHTSELPNTKTASPFQYFKDLMCMHGLVLLDASEQITPDFTCLIKFKLLLEQGNQKIVLCLSLYAHKNQFYFCVKDQGRVNPTDIKLKTLSANWQWQILKNYRGDVVDKILQNAKKVHADMLDCTFKFICLLKSIQLIKNVD